MKLSALLVCFAAVLMTNAQLVPPIVPPIIPPIIPPLFPPFLGLGGLGFGLGGFPFLGGLGGLGLIRPFGRFGRIIGKRDVDVLPAEIPVKDETLEVLPEVKPETVPVPEGEVKPETVPVPEGEIKPETVQVPEVEVKPETVPVPEGEVKPDVVQVPEVEVKPDVVQVPEGEVKPDVVQVPEGEIKPDTVQVETPVKTETLEVVPEVKPETVQVPEIEVKPETVQVETPVKAETFEVVPEGEVKPEIVQVPEGEVKPDTVEVPALEIKPDIVQVVSEKPVVEVPGVPQVEFPEVPVETRPEPVQLVQVPTNVDKPVTVPVVLKPTRTVCAISSVSRVLKCEGVSVEENFECEVIPVLQHINRIRLRLADLTIKAVTNETTPVFQLLSKKSFGKFTFVNPASHRNEILNIYMEQTVNKPGFLVRDRLCFAQFVSLISFLPVEQLKLTIIIN